MSSISKIEEQNQALQRRVQTLSSRMNSGAKRAQSTFVKLGSAFAIEAFDIRSKAEVAGVDGLIVVGLASAIASEFLDGDAAQMAGDIAETCGILYAAEAGREHRDAATETPAAT